MLLDREKISECLCRVLIVGKTVDDRDGTVLCKIYDILMSKSPYHDTVDHAGEDLGCIVDSLASSDLDVIVAQEQSLSAELVHADFEGNTCSCG